MFQLATQQTYDWPVTVQVPRSGGTWTKATFKAQFITLPQSRLNELIKREGNEDDEDLLREVLTGWEGVADEDGNPLPYSETTRDTLLDIPYVRIALIRAFFESLAGKTAKN